MKFLKSFLAIAVLCILSCQENDDTSLQVIETLQESEDLKVFVDDQVPLEEPWLSWDTIEFEVFVSDIARLTAYAVLSDTAAEAQFRGTMLDNGGVVALDQLLGANLSMQHFYNSFEQAYMDGGAGQGCRPDGFDPIPFPNGRSSSAFTMYLSNILNDHCIELYMPELYNPNTNIITAVSHPLNNRSKNAGYLLTTNNSGIGCIIGSDLQNVNSKYPASSYSNLIIARPRPNDGGIVVSNGTYCEYTIYDNIDFTLWFGN